MPLNAGKGRTELRKQEALLILCDTEQPTLKCIVYCFD